MVDYYGTNTNQGNKETSEGVDRYEAKDSDADISNQ